MPLEKGIGTCSYSFFYAAKKNNKKTTNKNSIETCQKTLSKPSSHFSALKIYSIGPFSNTDNIVCGHLIVRLSNK